MGIMRKDIKHEDGVIPQQEKTGNAGALSRLNPYPAYKDSGRECVVSPTIAPSERNSRITSSTNISAATAKPRNSSHLDQVQQQ